MQKKFETISSRLQEIPLRVVPYRIRGRLGAALGFVGSMILILMVFGVVSHSFHENPIAMAVALVVVLIAALALVYVFVKLVF